MEIAPLDTPKRRRLSKVWIVGLVTVVVLACTSLSGIVLYRYHHNAYTPLPSNTAALVDFPVYFPNDLDSKYRINPLNVGVSQQLVSYEITKKTDPSFRLTVNQQRLPGGYDFSQLGRPENNGKALPSKLGSAYIYKLNDRTNASIVTARTWIIISGSNTVSADDIEAITSQLVAIQ